MTFRPHCAVPLIALMIGGCGGGSDDAATSDVAAAPTPGVDAEPAPPEDSPFGPVVAAPDVEADGVPLDDVAPEAPDNGPAGQAPVGDSGDTAAIAGFWNLSRVRDDGADTVHVNIDGAGTVTTLDYQADAVGDGRACYLRSVSRIVSRGDDRYDIANGSILPGATSPDDVIILREGGDIVFRFLGEVFDPEFGTGEAGIEERFPASTLGDPAALADCADA